MRRTKTISEAIDTNMDIINVCRAGSIKGKSKGLMLDVGQHHILFSPNKQFEISNAITHAAFYIPDEFTTIRIKVKYDSLGKYDYVISEDYVELV